jgi:hypothetical protein
LLFDDALTWLGNDAGAAALMTCAVDQLLGICLTTPARPENPLIAA